MPYITRALLVIPLLLTCTVSAYGQLQFDTNLTGNFIDISATGTPLNLSDDAEVDIPTTVGNSVLPAGTARVGSNGGVRFSGTGTNLGVGNAPIPSGSAFAGDQTLLAFWDDINTAGGAFGNIYWQEISDLLIIQWDNARFFGSVETCTFQIQVHGSGPICAQFIYTDIQQPRPDGGGSATIGYQDGGVGFGDVQFSFNQSNAVTDGTVLSLVGPPTLPYQVNSAEASLDHNGVAGSGLAPAVTVLLPGELVTANVNTTLTGFPYEAIVSFPGPQVPRGDPEAIELNDGQVLNVDIDGPTSFFFYGGAIPSPRPAQNLALTFGAPNPPILWSSQLVFLDPASPSLLTLSAASSVNNPSQMVLVEANGTNSFNNDATQGYWSVTSIRGTISQVTIDSSTSSNPGQTALVFDTDQTGMADRFDGGNSPLVGCQGTYRNGSDTTAGLSYAGTSASPCDPLAQVGFVPSNQTVTNSFQTIRFDFVGGAFTPGVTFEFDCDTDGGLGINGSAMAGLVLQVVVDGVTLTGEMQADPADPDRGFVYLTN